MSKWGSEHFRLTNLNFGTIGKNDLESAVAMLPSRVRLAFYGAIQRKGVIKRSTWTGCAFNAGSLEAEFVENQEAVESLGVRSVEKAAEAFKISPYLVKNFINKWDNSPYSSDEVATKNLLYILEKVGLFNGPDMPNVVRQPRVVSETIHESTLKNEFIEAVTNDLDSFTEDFQKLLWECEQLLEMQPA